MASWRAPGSILEAPDSIFEAPGLDFRGSWDVVTDCELAVKAAQFRLEARVAHSSYSNIELQPQFPEGRVGGGAPPGGLQFREGKHENLMRHLWIGHSMLVFWCFDVGVVDIGSARRAPPSVGGGLKAPR